MQASRNRTDALLQMSAAVAEPDDTSASNSLDLGALSPAAALERIELEVRIPALPLHVPGDDDGTPIPYFATVTVEDSADNDTFAAIATLAVVSVEAVEETGSEAVTLRYKLPSSTRRYIRVASAVDEDAADSSDETITAEILT